MLQRPGWEYADEHSEIPRRRRQRYKNLQRRGDHPFKVEPHAREGPRLRGGSGGERRDDEQERGLPLHHEECSTSSNSVSSRNNSSTELNDGGEQKAAEHLVGQVCNPTAGLHEIEMKCRQVSQIGAELRAVRDALQSLKFEFLERHQQREAEEDVAVTSSSEESLGSNSARPTREEKKPETKDSESCGK